jgi:hypothetical protein
MRAGRRIHLILMKALAVAAWALQAKPLHDDARAGSKQDSLDYRA